MEKNRDKLLARIAKLFSLAQSSNPHEAALALQKAQTLMDEHGFTKGDVLIADIKEAAARVKFVVKPPSWLVSLANVVSDAFATGIYFSVTHEGSYFVFIGEDVKCKLSEYTFTVLRRRLQKERKAYFDKLRGKRSNRIAKADLYARGWVLAVLQEVQRFAQKKPQAVVAYLEQKGLVNFTAKQRLPSRGNALDHTENGFVDGKNVHLQHGVNELQQKRLQHAE